MTNKESRFVSEYLICLNAAEAARRAGYSERTAKQAGHTLLSRPEISAAIEERMHALDAEKVATIDEVMQTLTRVLRRQVPEKVVTNSGRVVDVPTPINSMLQAAKLLLKVQGAFESRADNQQSNASELFRTTLEEIWTPEEENQSGENTA